MKRVKTKTKIENDYLLISIVCLTIGASGVALDHFSLSRLNMRKHFEMIAKYWIVDDAADTIRPVGLDSILCPQSPMPLHIGVAPPPQHTPGKDITGCL